MKVTQLPTKLGKEPLIDVVCGVFFDSNVSADVLLPGLLLPKLAGRQVKFETLPVAQLPLTLRESDPNLLNAPLMRIVVDEQFTVLIASKWLGVGCLMPYAGWSDFKEMIQIVFKVLEDAPFVSSIERHSLKYVDFIEVKSGVEPLSRFNLKINIAGQKLLDQPTQFRTEIQSPPFLHAVNVVSSASAKRHDGVSIDGAVVDVDTHRIERFSVDGFLEQLPDLLDEIHLSNKAYFFSLLSEAGLNELEPSYD
jgi:uncharacterized protein (TIGR04255 family)